MNTFEDIIMTLLGWIIGIIVGSMILFLIMCGYQSLTCERVEKMVVEVGGCQRYECGVRYHDGTYGSESHPTVGRTYNVCKE